MGHKRKSEKIDLMKYLAKGNLFESMKLSESGKLTFHWADWDETCHYQIHMAKQNQGALSGKKKEGPLKQRLEELKETFFWVERSGSRKRLSAYDLYSSYLDPRIRKVLFEKGQDHFLLSTQYPDGPYLDARSLRWWNKEDYLHLVFLHILNEKLPLRNFRLRLSLPIELELQEAGKKTHVQVFTHQITGDGIVWMFPRTSLFKILKAEKWQVVMNLFPLYQQLKESLSLFPLFPHCSGPLSPKTHQHASLKDLRESSFSVRPNLFEYFHQNNAAHSLNELNRKEYYIFTPFQLFEPLKGENFIQHLLRPFVEEIKNQLTHQFGQRVGQRA